MQDESSRRYLFVAIDRATRRVFVQLKANKTAASAQAFLKALHKACPIRINKLLTDNDKVNRPGFDLHPATGTSPCCLWLGARLQPMANTVSK